MRIAVYLVGQWRGSSYDCAKYLKEIFKDFDTDYYIYIWDSYNGKRITTNTNLNICDTNSYTHTPDDIKKIRNSYPNVVSMEVGSTELMNELVSTDTTGLSSFPQFYQANEANKYRRAYENMNGFRYDAIIKLRPDIVFREGLLSHLTDRIKYIKKNPTTIFSHYRTLLENITPDVNLVWDYYTISSSFGMDCMMEWVRDVIDNKDSTTRPFLSNYIIKYKLIPNPEDKFDPLDDIHPTPTIMRELFKYNNLVDLFYKNKLNVYPLTFQDFLYDYLFRDNKDREKYDNWFDWIQLDKLDYIPTETGQQKIRILTETGLQTLSNLIIKNYETNEIRYKQEYGLDS